MKKKLEAELISIAHRILKLKNKSEIIQLHQETQKLYEKLSVLRFVEENFADAKPTIGQAEIEDKIEAAFETPAEPSAVIVEEIQPEAAVIAEPESEAEENEVVTNESAIEQEEQPIEEEVQPEEVSEVTAEENVEEPVAEVEEEIVAESNEETTVEEEEIAPVAAESPKEEDIFFKPAFELSFDNKPETEAVKEDAKEEFKSANEQITFEDILGSSYVDPVFVKAEDIDKQDEPIQTDNVIPIGRNFSDNSNVISINKTEDRSFSLNDRLSKGITIGLNDRVAFMKHLFANSSEDYNRVLSQLITFDTFAEAQYFIDNMVKPDYNNWEGKDEYAERFMEIVEKKFS